jgi:hypothetical protein
MSIIFFLLAVELYEGREHACGILLLVSMSISMSIY